MGRFLKGGGFVPQPMVQTPQEPSVPFLMPDLSPIQEHLCGKFMFFHLIERKEKDRKTMLFRGRWQENPREQYAAIMKIGLEKDPLFTAERYYCAQVIRNLRAKMPHVVHTWVNCEVSYEAVTQKMDVDVEEEEDVEDVNAMAADPKRPSMLAVEAQRQGLSKGEPLSALVMSEAPGLSVAALIRNYRRKWTPDQQDYFDWTIAVQVATFLTACASQEFMHNDLHTENVMCQFVPREQRYVLPYKVDGKHREVPFFVRIIDFNRATWQKNPNLGLYGPGPGGPDDATKDNLCFYHGVCPEFVRNYDWHHFLATYSWNLQHTQQRASQIPAQVNFTPSTKKDFYDAVFKSLRLPDIAGRGKPQPYRMDLTKLNELKSPQSFLNSAHRDEHDPRLLEEIRAAFPKRKTELDARKQ